MREPNSVIFRAFYGQKCVSFGSIFWRALIFEDNFNSLNSSEYERSLR